MRGLTLDAGALIALERGSQEVRDLLEEVADVEVPLSLPAAVLAQVWRGTSRQARLSMFLRFYRPEIVALDVREAKVVGFVCASSGTRDVVDASVVVCARRRGHAVVTSDPQDLAKIDPGLALITV